MHVMCLLNNYDTLPAAVAAAAQRYHEPAVNTSSTCNQQHHSDRECRHFLERRDRRVAVSHVHRTQRGFVFTWGAVTRNAAVALGINGAEEARVVGVFLSNMFSS